MGVKLTYVCSQGLIGNTLLFEDVVLDFYGTLTKCEPILTFNINIAATPVS